jgi:imidazolonepropionase-like amidohydrolase
MKNIKKLLIGLLGILILSISSCQHSNTENPDGLIAITHANIIDMDDGAISTEMTILIKGNIITEVAKDSKIDVPSNARVVNAKGKYVIPGLWDMHAHTSSEANTRNVTYPLFISNGVTGIRVMASDCFEPCWELNMTIEQSKKLQKEVKNKTLIGPRALLASTYIRGSQPGDSSTVKAPGTKEHGKELVRLLIGRGVDFIKIYDELSRDAYFGIAEEANKQGIVFAGHVPVAIKASEASDAGQKSMEHCCAGSLFEECSLMEEELRMKIVELINSENPKDANKLVLQMVKSYDDAKCQAVYRKFIANGTWFVPTLLAAERDQPIRSNWRTDPRLKYIPKDEIKWWNDNEENIQELYGSSHPEIREKRFEMVRDMNKAGVKLLAGADCGIYGTFWGSGLHDELALLVEAGLTELEALQSATINAVEYAQLSDSLGKIKEGMIADVILLDANPLEKISNTQRIHLVITNGQFIDRQGLDKILDKVAIEAAK